MKLTCRKSDLLKAVNIVIRAIPGKTTMPILECILINATTNVITFTSNDMELGIETIVPGTILQKGIIAVEARLFSDIVRKLPENEVILETDENWNTMITCEKAKFMLSGKSGEDFSTLPYVDRSESITLSQFTLKEMIRQTIFSISSNENNKIMTGELFEIKNDRLRVISLDGHRVSIRKVKLRDCYEQKKVIVPGKSLLEINKILSGETEDDVSIYFTQNHILFELEHTTVVSRLLEGEYFNIDQMLSSDYETKIDINRKEFLDCIDRATLFVSESDKRPIIMTAKEEEMDLRIQSASGSLNEEISIEKEGKDIQIGFNPKYLMDALRVIDDEKVTLYLMNAKAPCFIRNEEQSYIYLILPVNFMA